MSKSMVLRICHADMSSHGGFIWPKSGRVTASDWKANQTCGNGLHGWFEGQGDQACSDYHHYDDAKYLVLEVETSAIVHLTGKCKFPEADVVFVGSRMEAIAHIDKTYPHLQHAPLLFAMRTAGNNGTATVGNNGTATVGNNGTATVGDNGTATAGNNGTATAGNNGTATAGDSGTATAGKYGTATAGYNGTATAGDNGIIQLICFEDRVRILTGYIGEGNLRPNIKYRLDETHNFYEVR